MNLVMSILGFLLILSPIVIIHEFGHFLFARMNGIGVLKFSVGFGGDKWAIFSWVDKYGTKWQITPFLLGGFVTMKGQYDNPSDQFKYNEAYKNMSEKEKKDSFLFKNRAQKIAVAFAGPLFNLILSIVVLFGLSVFYGKSVTPNIVGGFSDNSVAQQAGMKVGDQIIKIDDKNINDFADILNMLNSNDGHEVKVFVKRDIAVKDKVKPFQKTLSFAIKPMKIGNSYKLGIHSSIKSVTFKKMSIKESAVYSVEHTYSLVKDFLSGMGQMISGKRSSKEIGGIISIAGISGKALNYGFYSVMYLMAFLSVVIGVMNLMPIPVLDGGQIFIYAFETFIRRDIPDKIKSAVFSLGWMVVLALMLLATYNDVKRVFIKDTSIAKLVYNNETTK